MKTHILKVVSIAAALILFVSISQLNAQTYSQVVRGTVVDRDTKSAIPGANIVIANSNPFVGTTSDDQGLFRFEDIQPGRITLYVTCMGYEKLTIPNLVVISGKESILELEMTQSFKQIGEVKVNGKNGKRGQVLNEMALLSARTVTVEETKRYAGSLDDPSRMVSAFAGVTSNPSGLNEIVVRGNSPKGIQWRLEGVEIPNPNHFSHQGTTGGPINALSSNMLSTSDFFMGAFSPEYGNVLSGIFDMKMRTGNNEQHEFTLGVGALGMDVAAEGPFKKGNRSSYNFNYRYSTLALMDNLKLVDFGGVPKYQDLSFKTNFVTQKAGTFSVFGLMGLSNISLDEKNEQEEVVFKGDQESRFGVVGANHLLLINSNSFIRTSVSVSNNGSGFKGQSLFDDGRFYESMKRNWNNNSLQVSSRYSNRVTANLRLMMGIDYKHMFYDLKDEMRYQNDLRWRTFVDMNENTGMLQSIVSGKYRIVRNLNLVGGLHYTHFMLNNSKALEPRVAVKWDATPRSSLNLGYGKHSMVENIVTYFSNVYDENMNVTTPNKDLGLTKANHFILGYDQRISKNINVKMELYYQDLYDVPVENRASSNYSIINDPHGSSYNWLVNKGKGRNYGVELTVERFFDNNYYFLFTGSLYETEYKTLSNVWYPTLYDGNYASNFLIGKEFVLGRPEKGNTLNLNTKVLYNGNRRNLPIDLEASRKLGDAVYDTSNPYAHRLGNIFQANFTASLKFNRKHVTHEILADFYNVFNNQGRVREYYNQFSKEVNYEKQLGLMPNIMYRIHF